MIIRTHLPLNNHKNSEIIAVGFKREFSPSHSFFQSSSVQLCVWISSDVQCGLYQQQWRAGSFNTLEDCTNVNEKGTSAVVIRLDLWVKTSLCKFQSRTESSWLCIHSAMDRAPALNWFILRRSVRARADALNRSGFFSCFLTRSRRKHQCQH